MNVIYGPRGSGRSQHLISLSYNDLLAGKTNYIVVRNHEAAYRLTKIAEQMGCNINFPMTYEEFIHRSYYGANISHLYIDNADDFLQYMAIVPIKAISIQRDG